jgi:F-type H+-transporting ATPase subunit a
VISLLASIQVPEAPPHGFPAPGTEILDYTKSCLVGSGSFCLTKVSGMMLLSMVIIVGFFIIAFRNAQLVPVRRSQRYAEGVVDIVRKGVILEVMGPEGMRYLPLLFSLFIFIWVNNSFGIVPFLYIPTTSRMAIPLLLAILVWFTYNIIGVAKQGVGRYFFSYLWPPTVPSGKGLARLGWTPIKVLVAVIEIVSVFLIRPLTLAVRLAANMIAGHLILAIFSIGTWYLFSHVWTPGANPVAGAFGIFSFALLIFMTAFEVLVAFLQAYIFTMLTAVYISGAIHPEH